MTVPDHLQCGLRRLDMTIPQVMGVLNVTPDSFSDGGHFVSRDAAISQAIRMVSEGATIIDVGGESTRPGASPVSEQEELDRVIPVVEVLSREVDVVISIDTSTPAVMLAGANAGAGLINDVRALQRAGALQAAAGSGLPVCLMHMQGTPQTMQDNPRYDQILSEIDVFLEDRIQACQAAGIHRNRLLIDPGFGFGKSLQHNLTVLKKLKHFSQYNLPVLAGLSRKSMIGAILDKPIDERVSGSVAAALIAVQQGAHIVRVHDVAATVDALKVWMAVERTG